MRYRNWRYAQDKKHFSKNKFGDSKKHSKSKDEMKGARNDEKELKKKKKRLTIDWFFRPEGD
jgi:hypothetical protein